MTQRPLVIAALLVLLATLPASAACPAPVAGDTPEAIRANQERLVCLQRELAELGERSATQFEIDQIGRDIDSIQLQRRFDALDFTYYEPPRFYSMSPESGHRFRDKDMLKNKELKRIERI